MKRAVRLTDLTPAMQAVVLALIAADRAAKPEAAPLSHRNDGTTSDKEKVTA